MQTRLDKVMNSPIKSDIASLQAITAAVMASLVNTKWNLDTKTDFGAGVLFASPPTTVAVHLAHSKDATAAYLSIGDITATSNIKLEMPTGGRATIIRKPPPDQVIRSIAVVVFGVLTHEFTHLVQKNHASAAYQVTIDLMNKFHASGKSPADWLDLYLDRSFEIEARAAQAAAEIAYPGIATMNRAGFEGALRTTEVFRRTDGEFKLAVGSMPVRVDAWWKTWEAMAWDIYQTW
jgi:hypothetical protein